MNVVSGEPGGGGAERFGTQIGDHFCSAYENSDQSAPPPGPHTKPRAYIMYTNDARTELICAMELHGWEQKSQEVSRISIQVKADSSEQYLRPDSS